MNDNIEVMRALASLYKKKAAVMQALEGGMAKTGKNDHFNYKFVEASSIKHTVGQLFAAHGISIQVSGVATENTTSVVELKNGNTKQVPILRIQFAISLCDTDTGAVEQSYWFGEAEARDDKAASKAATSALKYYLISNLMIADKTEDKRDTDRGPAKRPASQPSAPDNRPAQTPPPAPASVPSETGDILRHDDRDRFLRFLTWAKNTHSMSETDVMRALYQIEQRTFKSAPAARAKEAVEEWAAKQKVAVDADAARFAEKEAN